MIITVNSQALATELRLLNKVVPVKPTIPYLAYVHFIADDEVLTLEGTNLEIGLRTLCRAAIERTGALLLPAKKLLEMLEQFPEAEVRIEEIKDHVVISSGNFRSRLQTLPAEDFPRLPAPEGELGTADLRGLIQRVRYAIADRSTQYALDGAFLSLDGVAAMVATDGKRLSIATAGYQGPKMSDIVPSETMDLLMDFDGPIEITRSERHLFFAQGTRLLISRKIDSQFPAYHRVIPKDNEWKAIVDRHALAAALRRVGVVSDLNFGVWLDFVTGFLSLTAKSHEIGDALEQLPVDYEGPDMRVCVNWKFLLDFLEAAAGQNIVMALKDANSALLLTDGESFLNVVMTMRP